MSTETPIAPSAEETETTISRFMSAIGYVLGISYPLLALSTGARGVYQLFFRDDLPKLAPALSIFSSLLYLVAAVGFFKRSPRAWRVSVTALSIEAIGVLTVGTLSILAPDLLGHTAWSRFGMDYGFFPLIQPLLGLSWLLYRPTRAAYGVGPVRQA
ncbi:MAG: hypothetical protein M9927_14035 [Anaerolineae bacterium]|nr:hypothetical protein [Anaerolineae bacterium]